MLSRRLFLGGALNLGLAACSTDNSLISLVGETLRVKSPPRDRYPMTAQQVAALPYATLGVQRGDDGARAVVVLVRIEDGQLEWVSADNVILVTSGGRLVRTRGLQRDLLATHWPESQPGDPLADFVKSGRPPAATGLRTIDLDQQRERKVVIESRYVLAGRETIAVLGRNYKTWRLDETAVVPQWRWESRQSFWIDAATGAVRRSIQQFCPESAPLTLEVLKPAATA